MPILLHKTSNESFNKRSRELLSLSFFFQGSRLLKNDSKVLLTDSYFTETDLTDSLTLIYSKLDGGCYFNSPFISKFLDYSNFAQLLSEQPSKKHFFYFIEVLLVHPRKPKCFCWKQNIFPPKYRSLVRQRKILWNKLCVL